MPIVTGIPKGMEQGDVTGCTVRPGVESPKLHFCDRNLTGICRVIFQRERSLQALGQLLQLLQNQMTNLSLGFFGHTPMSEKNSRSNQRKLHGA